MKFQCSGLRGVTEGGGVTVADSPAAERAIMNAVTDVTLGHLDVTV